MGPPAATVLLAATDIRSRLGDQPEAGAIFAPAQEPTHHDLVRRGQRLEYFTIEALVSIVAGIFAWSGSLAGFGLDSLNEVTSGAALLWRLRHDLNPSRR